MTTPDYSIWSCCFARGLLPVDFMGGSPIASNQGWVEVETSDGTYAATGDCIYRYVNVERMWPPAYLQGNPWNMLATFKTVLATVGGNIDHIIPGHDMEIFRRHPSWTSGMNPLAEIHLAKGEHSRQS